MTNTAAPQPDDRPADIEPRTRALLARAYEFAAMPLEGINEAAEELAAMTDDEVAVIDRARKLTAERLAVDPDRATKQVASLIRRAMEVGMWRWRLKETQPVDTIDARQPDVGSG